MILYLDTSALLKKYFKEKGSDEVSSNWKDATAIVTSSVAYGETLAAIYRKKREVKNGGGLFTDVLDAFRKDWASFIRVEVSDDLNEWIDKIVSRHPLRGFDAIHLSSALIIHDKVPETLTFACYDKRLLKAAQAERLDCVPKTL